MVARSLDQYKYPVGHARAGQLNEEAAGDLKQWLMTTVEADLMADTMMLQGPICIDDAEHKLNGADFAVPDVNLAVWVTFANATASQVCSHLTRKCAEAVTVSSMVSGMKASEFDPEGEA